MPGPFDLFPSSVADRSVATPSGVSVVMDGLSALNRDSADSGVRLGVLLSAAGRRSYGPLLLVVGLFSISPATVLPGLTSLTALIILLIALQMALGFRRPWLPRRVLDLKAPRQAMFLFIDKCRPAIDRVDSAFLRERWSFLSRPPFVHLIGVCVAAAALITLPLGLIPFAPLAPGIAVVLFGLGMTARDGLVLSVGVACTAGAFWLAWPLIT